jgi:flagellar protein FliO/FliZ
MTAYLQFLAALVFVIALIGVAALAARRFGFGNASAGKGGRRRLGLVEVLPLDGRRKLVLMRCDDREHLVILGPSGETVVERAIAAREARFVDALQQDRAAKEAS